MGLAAFFYELVSAIPSTVSYFGPDRNNTWRQVAEHERRLQCLLQEYLRGRDDVIVYGDPSGSKELRVPVIGFSVKGRSSKAIVEGIGKRCGGYACRWGHFYSKRLVDDVLGLSESDGGSEGQYGAL